MGVLDDEELVGPLEKLVDRGAHRALDDRDEILRVDADRRPEEELASTALVVRRKRDELEDPLDLRVGEARLAESRHRLLAHETLRARAGVDPRRLDTDEAPRRLRRRCGDPDACHELLRAWARDGRGRSEERRV